MSIHEAKTMGEVMALVLRVSSRAEGKRFVMEYLEAAPDLTEKEIVENIKFGLSRHFDCGGDDEYRRMVSFFVDE